MSSEEALHAEQPAQEPNPLFEYIRYSEFKRLLGQIHSNLDRNGHRSVAVVSELPGEGKSFLVSALALGYSTLLDKRVLVVNTVVQPQKKALHLEAVYRGRGQPAFPDLPYSSALSLPLRAVDVISPHLDGDGAALESTDFQIGQYVQAARDQYDLILLDTCALSVTNKNNVDPVVIAKHSDTSILVTSSRTNNREMIDRAKARIAQWNLQLMGAIYNAGAVR